MPLSLEQLERMGVLREEWRVVSRDPRYEVSSFGRVRRAIHLYHAPKHGLLKLHKHKGGHLYVYIGGHRGQHVFVSALVLEAFVGPRPSKHEVDHLDSNVENNRLDNLEYVTHLENIRRTIRRGRRASKVGEANGRSRLTAMDVAEIKGLLGKVSQRKLAARFRVHPTTIANIATGKRWSHVAAFGLEDFDG